MRCAISINEEETLKDQLVRAYGELQHLDEEPEYREEDIKDKGERNWFRGYKWAVDDLFLIFDDADYWGLSEETVEDIKSIMYGNIVEHLFDILDNEPCENGKMGKRLPRR